MIIKPITHCSDWDYDKEFQVRHYQGVMAVLDCLAQVQVGNLFLAVIKTHRARGWSVKAQAWINIKQQYLELYKPLTA